MTFDPDFASVKNDACDSQWQFKAGFVKQAKQKSAAAKRKSAKSMAPSEGASAESMAPAEGATMGRKRPRLDPLTEPSGSLSTNNGQTTKRVQVNKNSPDQEEGLSGGRSNGHDPTGHTAQPGTSASVSGTRSTKSGRVVKPINRLINAMSAELSDLTKTKIEGETFCLQAIYPDADVNSFEGFDENPLLAHKASADPDTMHMHQAMKQPDKKQFIKAMKKEWQDQLDSRNFSVIHCRNVPQGATVLPAVWQMKRKQCIKTRQIKK